MMNSMAHSLNILDKGIDREADQSQTMAGNGIPTFNGIAIPDEVIRQLRMLSSTPVSRLTRGEIEDAVLGFEGDAQIEEDPNGHTLRDKMRLTWDEEQSSPAQKWTGYDYWPEEKHNYSFVDSLAQERVTENKTSSKSSNDNTEPSFVERYSNPTHYLPSLSF